MACWAFSRPSGFSVCSEAAWELVRNVEFQPHPRPPQSTFGAGSRNPTVLEVLMEGDPTEHEPHIPPHMLNSAFPRLNWAALL